MRLIGLVVVRNHLIFEYTPEMSVESLLPVCDEVLLVDMSSDDGSAEVLQEFAKTNPKIRFVSQIWDRPYADINWWTRAINRARELIPPNDWLIHLDADEALGENCSEQIRGAMSSDIPILFRRHNFWRDAKHLVAENRACGEMVARAGKASFYLPSDEPNPLVHPNLRTTAEPRTGCEIFHYGFLRDDDAFIRKSIEVQNAFMGSCDPRVLEHWKDKSFDFFDGLPLRDFIGTHPACAHAWLKSKGYL